MNENNQVDLHLDFHNFDPEEIQTEQTINIVLVVDVSPSIQGYEDELNAGLNEFYETMQKSHVAEQIMVSTLTFNEKVKVVNGFQPILNINQADFHGHGCATALYDGTLAGLQNALKYRDDLKQSGVQVKTLLFVITDGMDNNSSNPPYMVKEIIGDLMKDEANMFTFDSILFGVGQDDHYFTEAKEEMGIQHIATVGTTGPEIRKMINIISSSVSQVSNNQSVSF